MARITLLLLTVMLVALVVVHGRYYGRRVRRGFNNNGNGFSHGIGGKGGGFGRDSDEHDASVSQENNSGGCILGQDKSGSREMAYNRDGRQQQQPREHARGGRSFTRSSATASATASASSFTGAQNKKKNVEAS